MSRSGALGSTVGVIVLDRGGLDALIARLSELGYDVRGPVVRDGAIMTGSIATTSDLPVGVADEASPGRYTVTATGGDRLFGWAVGPTSAKSEFFPPRQIVWRRALASDATPVPLPSARPAPVALFGVRPCDVASLGVLDRVFSHGAHVDARYQAGRSSAFIVVAECASPSGSCFCGSMGTGPGAEDGFDVALAELDDQRGHRFVARAGSERGRRLLEVAGGRPADLDDLDARDVAVGRAADLTRDRLESTTVANALAHNLDSPIFDEIAERCLACGNCTLVCPTCFCSDVRDTTTVGGTLERTRTWASCFDLDHSQLHGGPVRVSTASRYRQWVSHKLSTWWDQFGCSGCVGCGRCLTWCPVGIDLIEEVRRIDGRVGSARSASESGGAP